MTGTVLEEGLRGAGGYLLNGARRALHAAATTRAASVRRATSCRARSTPKCARATPRRTAAFTSAMGHLGPETSARQFKGMVERCADCGFDLAGGLVEVVPTAHYMMGGVVFDARLHAPSCPGLFAAGEDTGGVHGANRLGGNGVANSTVFGGIAGDVDARWMRAERRVSRARRLRSTRRLRAAARRSRNARRSRRTARDALRPACGTTSASCATRRVWRAQRDARTSSTPSSTHDRHRRATNLAFNLTWHDWLNLKNLILVSRSIRCAARRARIRAARISARTFHSSVRWNSLRTSPFAGKVINTASFSSTSSRSAFRASALARRY